MTEDGQAAVVPTEVGVTDAETVKPPWWDDPQEAHRESVRVLHVIAAELAVMNRRLERLESLVPQGFRSPLAGLFQPRR